MRLSRPCYDKYHRCPGWVGGGGKYAKTTRCNNGRIMVNYDNNWWRWAVHRCNTCDVVVFPYYAHWLDPTWLWYELKWFLRNPSDRLYSMKLRIMGWFIR